MSDSKKRFTSIMLGLFVIGSIALSLQAVLSRNTGIVPILGLDHAIHMLLFNMIWPVFGSVLFVLIFPRIFAPFYLKLKGVLMPNFKNGQVQFESEPYSLKKWFSRCFYVALLVLGIQAALFSFFPFEAFLTPTDLTGYLEESIDIRFVLGVTTAIVGILTPIAAGIFSVGWSLEDSGLVHYDIPKEADRLYEIEPIFRRYTSYIKGYAGLSSILFLASIVAYFLPRPDRAIDALITMILPLIAILSTTLAYYAYVKTNRNFLRGKYPDVGQVTEEEILS